jgi:hypothetical protein
VQEYGALDSRWPDEAASIGKPVAHQVR